MNTAAATLLRSLDNCGIQSIRFRVVSLGGKIRHTIPLAHSPEETKDKPFSDLSVESLFSAYSLTARRGEYILDVVNGTLSFIPPVLHPSAPSGVAVLKKHRAKAKRSRRQADAPHRLAA